MITVLYVNYPALLVIIGILLFACMIGAVALTINRKERKDG